MVLYNPGMKIRRLAIAATILLLAGCTAPASTTIRGSGNVITTHRDVSGFSEVALLGTGTLTITQTGSEALTIEAEDNIMPKIKTEVTNNRLMIGFEDA